MKNEHAVAVQSVEIEAIEGRLEFGFWSWIWEHIHFWGGGGI